MKLIKFIKENENWEELLSAEPYNIKITYDGNFACFKYNQLSSDFNLDIVKECRGVILDTRYWCVAARGFDKFFNYGEIYASDINWSSAWVSEKVDGSIMKMWYCDEEWHISTNSVINAEKATLDSSYAKNFKEIFDRVFPKEFNLNILNKSFTYIFELVSPYHLIVVPYTEEKLYYLGARNNITGEEVSMLDNPFAPYIDHPKIYSMGSLDEVLETAEKLPWTEEGYVVCDANFNRIKIKSPAYVASHYLANNHVITDWRIIKILFAGEDEEFLGYFPQYTDRFEYFKNKIKETNEFIEFLNSSVISLVKTLPRENVYNSLKQSLNKYFLGYVMRNYDNEVSWENYTKHWSEYKWAEFFNSF